MKLARIGNQSFFENLSIKSLNRPEHHLVITKPLIGIWFCFGTEWLAKLNTDWHSRLVGQKDQEFTFSGKLLDEDNITSELIRKIPTKYNGELIALDFDKIKNLGFDGVICRNPTKRFFKDWDVPSIVIWSSMDKLKLIQEKDIPYPTDHVIDQLRSEFYDVLVDLSSCDYDDDLYNKYDDISTTMIKKTIPDLFNKFPEYANSFSFFSKLEKNTNVDQELILLNFKYDNYTMIKYFIQKELAVINYMFSISIIIEDSSFELIKGSRSINIANLNQEIIDTELNYITKICKDEEL